MSIGGSIQSITIKGREFSVTADADTARQIGGFGNAVEMNGDGTARVVKTRGGWSLSGLVIAINDNRNDQEFLQELADGKDADPEGFFPITITYASNLTWGGRGIPIETIEYASMNSTAGISLAGPGALTRQ
jgi:hypothetical protein